MAVDTWISHVFPMDRKAASYEVKYETYEKQRADPQCWVTGHAITAQYTDEAILVYQAFENSIGNYAVKHQTFVGMSCPAFFQV